MEEFYIEESNPKHVFFKCLVIIFIIGLCIGGFLFYKNENTIKLRVVSIEVGEELSNSINDYLVNGNRFSNDYKLYLDGVDNSKVGEYTYKVKYNKHIKKGIIKVVDIKKPEVVVNDIIIGVDEKLDPNILIRECKDDSLPCRVALVNESDVNKLKIAGKYEIEIDVSDAEGNVTKTKVNITSSETESLSSLQTDDLNYYTNSENDDSIEHVLFAKLDKAIDEETLEYEGLIQEVSAVDFSEYVDEDKEIYDTKLITAYNKYSYVIGIQVLVTFTDGSTRLLTK